jgi:hypothetical protein
MKFLCRRRRERSAIGAVATNYPTKERSPPAETMNSLPYFKPSVGYNFPLKLRAPNTVSAPGLSAIFPGSISSPGEVLTFLDQMTQMLVRILNRGTR